MGFKRPVMFYTACNQPDTVKFIVDLTYFASEKLENHKRLTLWFSSSSRNDF